MPTTRQDAWSQDEDLFLAEVVLRHIREGGTQLQAFEEVGKQLNRTSAACGFRWNSYVRKQYKSGIELAKKQRKEAKKPVEIEVQQTEKQDAETPIHAENTPNVESDIQEFGFEQAINYLKGIYEKAEAKSQSEDKIKEYQDQVQSLEKKLYYLSAENEKLTKDLKMVEEDYKALIEIMERARKMVVLQDEDRQQKVRFQMDKNGNLEKVEK
ncbi:RsfA family transcriptional regulator [Cytobacillus spongiae]|jgi:predicted  nucleic acid-binding Zn-ribbon protein|uniref:RsfA family transcriptional regulator n=1 Tax=Cytobacillus spongiae TaxID=2901381 RepID=UPI001F28EF07|nr:RsfA family transcriptional regulator [Cytobacillus spongiae]UII57302.1 RsfA family transcriptional regulator [Cytobacillus spongiae]